MNNYFRFCTVLLSTLLALILSWSCAQNNGIQPDYPYNLNTVITMYRGQSYSPCPVYSVTINGDGSVVYEGYKYVEVTGTQTGQIPAEDVRDLVYEFIWIGYFSLEDTYLEGPSDGVETTTSLTLDGETKQVRNYAWAHFELGQLENLIDEVAHTAQWVGDPDYEDW